MYILFIIERIGKEKLAHKKKNTLLLSSLLLKTFIEIFVVVLLLNFSSVSKIITLIFGMPFHSIRCLSRTKICVTAYLIQTQIK